ncbi:MAG: lysophospholipid acyltransferase family protein [Negativicutes bacterium]|nr:lysophospholipid acyltransferase family protein [Negativicutes bacterium]
MSNEWQYHLLKTISRIVCLLPYRAVLFLGRQLGKLYYHIAARQRRRALAQLIESTGVSPAEGTRIIKKLFLNLGQTFLEVMYIPSLTPEKIKKYVTIENRHYLEDAVAEGHGVVFLTAHVGNWEWLGAALAMDGFPMTTVIKRQPNDQHTRILNEYREMVGLEIFARGTTELIAAAKALKKGKVLGFLADQDAGYSGVFLKFLGKMASTPLGPAVFARKFKAPVVPVFIVRRPEGGHRVMIYPPLYYENIGGDPESLHKLTERMTKITEDTIRQYPDQWLWFQKRWNTPFKEDSCIAYTGPASPTVQERIGEQV